MVEPPTSSPAIYQLRIVLRGVSPLLWRRLLVASDSSLAELHAILNLSSFRLRQNSLVRGAESENFRATLLPLSPSRRLGEKRQQIQLGKQRVELWWDLSQQALGVLSCDFQSADPDRL